ncbi:MAG: CapA family protein, partial [Firmicutes bacterium]|nr:CapA family protein [Bacillota bacterium]
DINLKDFSKDSNYFEPIMHYLNQMNASIGNLEGLLAEPKELYYKPGFTHVGEGHAPILAKAGFKAFNLANNCTFGAEPIKTTLKQLDEAGIAHTGAGMNIAEAKKPAIIDVNGYRIGIVSGGTAVFWPIGHAATEKEAGVVPIPVTTSYQPNSRYMEMPGAPPKVLTVVHPEYIKDLQEQINALRQEVDIVVAFFHFGLSSRREIVDYQRELAHAAIDAGADVVLGSHTHVIQPIEVYKNRPIVYGMGQVIYGWDFVARKALPGQPGLIVELDIDSNDKLSYSATFVKPDENLLPRIVSFADVPEEVEYLRSTSSAVIEFKEDRITINTNVNS